MIKINYKKPFFQFFPVLFIKNDTEKVLIIGFGHKNISFVKEIEKFKVSEKSNRKLADGDEEFVFIWYKKLKIGNKTHYTEPFRTKIIASDREEAVESLKKFALKRMVLCVHEESDFNNSEYSKIRDSFDEMNKNMEKMTRFFDNNK